MEIDQQFLESIIKAIVKKPESVAVTRSVDQKGVLLTLEVDKEDTGLIIGKAGSTINAIRTIIRTIGMKNNSRVSILVNQ